MVLVAGNISTSGLYLIKESNKPSIVSKTDGTAIYDDLAENYIYHKQGAGWVVASHKDPETAIIIAHIDHTNLIVGGKWQIGVSTICLDDHKFTSNSVESCSDCKTPITDQYPFNGEVKSMNGLFCSKVEANGTVFDYIHRTDT